MAKYRYGLYENFFGDQWYQVQVKRLGIWWDDESFSTEKGMMKYVEQLRKQGHILKSTVVIITSVAADGKERDMYAIPYMYIFGWLFSIDTSKVNPEAKESVIKYKQECYKALYDHFTAPKTFLKQKQEVMEQMIKEYQSLQQDFKDAKNKLDKAKSRLNNIMNYTIEDWEADNRQLNINF